MNMTEANGALLAAGDVSIPLLFFMKIPLSTEIIKVIKMDFSIHIQSSTVK